MLNILNRGRRWMHLVFYGSGTSKPTDRNCIHERCTCTCTTKCTKCNEIIGARLRISRYDYFRALLPRASRLSGVTVTDARFVKNNFRENRNAWEKNRGRGQRARHTSDKTLIFSARWSISRRPRRPLWYYCDHGDDNIICEPAPYRRIFCYTLLYVRESGLFTTIFFPCCMRTTRRTIPALSYDPRISGYLAIIPGIPGLSRNLMKKLKKKKLKELCTQFFILFLFHYSI